MFVKYFNAFAMSGNVAPAWTSKNPIFYVSVETKQELNCGFVLPVVYPDILIVLATL